MYRLFLKPLSSLISLQGEERRYVWMAMCKSPECFDIVQRELLPTFYEDQLEVRFELAVRTSSYTNCAEFLRRVRLHMDDRRLATLEDKYGRTALHCVAGRVWKLIFSDFPNQELREWIDLGVHVVRNGADPHKITKQDPEDHARSVLVNGPIHSFRPGIGTPLLECIDVEDWRLSSPTPLWLARTLEALQVWMEMVERGGYNLLDYGVKETAVWRQLGIGDLDLLDLLPMSGLLVAGLSCSASPQEWDLNVRREESHTLRRLHAMPGTISQISNGLPDTIAWTPTIEEDLEGPCLDGQLIVHHKGPVRGFQQIIYVLAPGTGSSTAWNPRIPGYLIHEIVDFQMPKTIIIRDFDS
ncbi:hypothetical protein LTR97_006252 [Elasticomyces elasticus]|uniref:Uncharacterized protein n=1 Tax=Elasticomyces elasticus TaxID=574655 RepID=A0AAN7ZTQ1_9PEZI|nr:hypothetical protein LTR97_006252 [Elasticomyces elasticus]